MIFRASRGEHADKKQDRQGSFEKAAGRDDRQPRTGITESWVKPDGTVERNIRMDLVIAAAKKAPERQP